MKFTNQIKSIAIGSFDGLHLAHQELIALAQMVVVIERNGGYLTPGYKRTEQTDKPCAFYHFEKISALTPEAFIAKLKEDFPQLEKIVVGYDFHFGKAKAGNTQTLKALFEGEVVIIDEVSCEGVSVHSRTIKAYLREGNILMANALLGREYHIEGYVITGQGLGKKKLVPTLNLAVDHYQMPLDGVYATKTKIDGTWRKSISFLGHRVTTDGSYAVETHLLDAQIETPTGHVELAFIDFIRANQKFETLDGLRMQIKEDIESAKGLLK